MHMNKEQYNEYVAAISPKSKHLSNVVRAFVVGGLICVIGEALARLYIHLGMEEANAYTFTAITLIFLAALLTGLNVYDKLSQIGKAGALIPITGFSNAVTSPAMEFKREGHVAGLATKLFAVAGPVLVFGPLAATVYGVIYYLFLRG